MFYFLLLTVIFLCSDYLVYVAKSYITWFILYLFRVVPQCDMGGHHSGYVRAGSCPTLCHPMDCRPPGSSLHGISQARIVEWVSIHFLLQGILLTQDRTHISCTGRWILNH